MTKATKKSAAMTNAQRQAAYRQKHLHDPDSVDSERLSMLVSVHASAQLTRLARHFAVTKRAMIEKLLSQADSTVADALPSKKQTLYYDDPVTR